MFLYIVFIFEMKVVDKVLEYLRIKLGFENVLGVSSVGLVEGLVIFWRDIMDFYIIFMFKNYIMGEVMDGGVVVIRFIGVYGWLEK